MQVNKRKKYYDLLTHDNVISRKSLFFPIQLTCSPSSEMLIVWILGFAHPSCLLFSEATCCC